MVARLISLLPVFLLYFGRGQTCESTYCLNGGICSSDPARVGCDCTDGYMGFYCELRAPPDPCQPSVCMNGGRCPPQGPPFPQDCECTIDYLGYYCQTPACMSNADCNGGECATKRCLLCPAGFGGPLCENAFGVFCGDVVGICLNGGDCVQQDIAIYTCTCPVGYSGTYCETLSTCSSTNICQNRGDCVNGICVCGTMFTGDLCEIACTDSMPCLNGGMCFDGRCECTDGYAGAKCAQIVNSGACVDTDCMNGGSCDTNGVCECVDDFRGMFCERACDANDQCSNGGLCEPKGTCTCVNDFVGTRCETVCTDDAQCHNTGTCDGGTCACFDGYNGIRCAMQERCVDEDCLNGGSCDINGVCECADGFEGSRCELELCVDNQDCLNGGSCNIQKFCECVDGFEGSRCELSAAALVCIDDTECLNGGVCNPATYMCECIDGYTGSQCQTNPPASLSITVIAVAAVGGLVLLIFIVVLILLIKKRLRKRDYRKPTDGGQLEMGDRKRKKSNEYVQQRGKGPAVAKRPHTADHDPDGKEFPRELLHVMEQLGAGSFATVHKAEADGIIKKGIMSTVAVKMLKSTATDGDKSDFEKERSMYLNLGYHPNVVTMLGFCTEMEPFFLIMEYLSNGNLQTYLRHIRTGDKEQYFDLKEKEKRNFLLPGEILSFTSQVASGMEFLASKSCIHRDLATRNILLGDDLIAKVSDFGLARDIEDSSQYEMKSKGRVPVRWMAPESLLDNVYTSKSDVWGFAVLMWELVTLGSHPYPGLSSRQVIDEIKGGYRLPKPESCSDEIYDMMRQCWNEKPEHRPTFTEICKILENMMADASGYLVMTDLNRDDYLYLEPNANSTLNTADDF